MESTEKPTLDSIKILYDQTTRVAEAFWEWRHKVMTRFFTAIAGIFVVAGWFYKDQDLKPWVFAPFLVGACFSVISHLLDRVNTHVLLDCFRVAKELEAKILNGGSIFTCIENIYYHKGSYYGILRVVYLGTAIIFVALAVASWLLVK